MLLSRGALLHTVDGDALVLARVLGTQPPLVTAAITALPVRAPGAVEGIATEGTWLVGIGHLTRALATQHAIRPRTELGRGAVGGGVAHGTRVCTPAAREAQPAERVLEVRARALIWKGLPNGDAKNLELIGILLSQLLEQALELVLVVVLERGLKQI